MLQEMDKSTTKYVVIKIVKKMWLKLWLRLKFF